MATTTKTTTSKKNLNVVVTETAEQLEKAAIEAKEQAVETLGESKENIEAEVKKTEQYCD